MRVRACAVALVVLAGTAAPAWTQQAVKLQFEDGLVTLTAQNAPIRTILAEWARLGGATIVNGDRVAGPPVTLELSRVPERQALDTLLRTVAGYMLAPRRPGSIGASAFDRILILPTSAAPRTPPPSPASTPRVTLPRPPVGLQPGEPPGAGLDSADDLDAPGEAAVEPFTPGQPPGGPRVLMPPRPFQPPPVGSVFQPPSPGGPEPQVVVPGETDPEAAPSGVAPTPSNPFGIPFGSSTTPGVVTTTPPRQQPQGTPAGQGRR